MSWKVEYVFLILISTIIDYYSGIMMAKKADRKSRFPFLVLSLISNLGLLFFFKYYDFTINSINRVFSHYTIDNQLPIMNLLLPVGISFYTFQTLSYSLDVYYGRQKAEKHFGYFALYVSFFPQLVAGPIERFSRLAPQFRAMHKFSYDNLVNGLRLIIYGLFIKMVIADNISVFVDQVYLNPQDFNSLDILKGIALYSIQIYSDFYGYSLIAIGSALILGIKIMDNFKTPYLATNISEFWQRWHISLSTWFRDYVYFPLGGNQESLVKWMMNILIVFIVSGIWHGANWTFIMWGGIYGLIYLIEKLFNKLFMRKEITYKAFSVTHLSLAFKNFILVTLIWVFFRSQSLGEAINLFKTIIHNMDVHLETLSIPNYVWLFVSVFIVSDFLLYNNRFDKRVGGLKAPFRWLIYTFLMFSIIVFSGVENYPFIYFQF